MMTFSAFVSAATENVSYAFATSLNGNVCVISCSAGSFFALRSFSNIGVVTASTSLVVIAARPY